jgi:hypothetical protein
VAVSAGTGTTAVTTGSAPGAAVTRRTAQSSGPPPPTMSTEPSGATVYEPSVRANSVCASPPPTGTLSSGSPAEPLGWGRTNRMRSPAGTGVGAQSSRATAEGYGVCSTVPAGSSSRTLYAVAARAAGYPTTRVPPMTAWPMSAAGRPAKISRAVAAS